MATQILSQGDHQSDWHDKWEGIDACLQQAAGIVSLINVSGNPNQNAAWAVENLLQQASELHTGLWQELHGAGREPAHD